MDKQKNDQIADKNVAFLVLGIVLGITVNWGVGIVFFVLYFVGDSQKEKTKNEDLSLD